MGGENRSRTRKNRIDRNQPIEPRRGEKVTVRESANKLSRQAQASATLRRPEPGGQIVIHSVGARSPRRSPAASPVRVAAGTAGTVGCTPADARGSAASER